MRIYYFVIFLTALFSTSLHAQVHRIDPPNWWVGMNNPDLQLMVHGDNISQYTIQIEYPNVHLVSVEKVESSNYLFLNIRIDQDAEPGKVPLTFLINGKVMFTKKYELKKRKQGSSERTSFSSEDAVYLIMPDRFVNGDPDNDVVDSMLDNENRDYPEGRHGGDIQGVINRLDYIKDMGFTAIWLTPVRENNMERASYHGYAITDFFRIDPRHGSNKLYCELSRKCKEKGIKLIMDVVTNHCGTNYFWKDDLPTKDWYNDYPDNKNCSFRPGTWSDIHVSSFDIYENESGWFDLMMPDLNHHNPYLATYLIQNTIWWVEYANLDGLRSDTHAYNNREFISDWAKSVLAEYPNLNIVGEVWLKKPSNLSYLQKDAVNKTGFNSNLPMVMDLPLHFAIREALFETTEREKGLERLYEIISRDFLYPDPDNLMLVIDNHDVSRIYNLMGNDLANYKLAITFIATTRGMPQLFAGSEILMEGDKEEGDGIMRRDFPGGWKGDKSNGFTSEGLSKKQIEAQAYVKKLLNWRKTNEAVLKGKLIHYIPHIGVYIYFRKYKDSLVMILLNSNFSVKAVNTKRYSQFLSGNRLAVDVISGNRLSNLDIITIPARSALILEVY